MTFPLAVSSKPQFIKHRLSEARNRISLFVNVFEIVDDHDQSFAFNLFVETRYRLWVNGAFVTSGPARFVSEFPEYDSIDLGPWIRKGTNCIAVEVHFFGCSSYQTTPNGTPRFIAWSQSDFPYLATPGNWRTRILDAWSGDTSLFSFAQNACEVCDLRRTNPEWYLAQGLEHQGWEDPIVLSTSSSYGTLTPRSVALPSLAAIRPTKIKAYGKLHTEELLFGFHFPEKPFVFETPHFTAFHTWLFSPSDKRVPLSRHWGSFWLNGSKIENCPTHCSGLKFTQEVELQKGWNCLCGYVQYLQQTEYWDALFSIPNNLEIKISSNTRNETSQRLSISPCLPKTEILQWIENGRPIVSKNWLPISGSEDKITPARVAAWKTEASQVTPVDLPFSELGRLQTDSAADIYVFEFPHEALGHLSIEIEANVGQVIDICFDEWLTINNAVDLFRTNPFLNSVERYTLRNGKQRIIGLNPRGCRYVQIILYPNTSDSLPTIRNLSILSTQTYRSASISSCFQSSSEKLNQLSEACLRTFVCSTEDAFSDSPWRERGTYIGDLSVNQSLERLLSSNLAVSKRCIRTFAQAQLSSGQLPPVAPSHHLSPLEDYSLIWILVVYDYWAATGDTDLVASLWPNIQNLLESSSWENDSSRLWSAQKLNCFVDWGVLPEERSGNANGVLNAFRIAALERAADLAKALSLHEHQQELLTQSSHVRLAFSESLWLADLGRFGAFLNQDGTVSQTRAAHTNLLAWVLKIGSDRQQTETETYLFNLLDQNHSFGRSHGQFSGQLELYFLHYLLPALAERGHGLRAYQLIKQQWYPIIDDGFDTLPECFSRIGEGIGTRCHSWSGFPAVWLSKYILGLRQKTPGDPKTWILSPLHIPEINYARGHLPVEGGNITAKWIRKENGELAAEIEAPSGISVQIAPQLNSRQAHEQLERIR